MTKAFQGGADIQFIVQAEQVERAYAEMALKVSPVGMAGYLQAFVDPWIRERAEARFSDEGDDVVGKWAPLQEVTANFRAQAGYGAYHPINERTGELRDYITNSPNNVNIHPAGATLQMPGQPPTGELEAKVKRAQKGSQSPNTPARPVMGMNEGDLAFVLTSMSAWFNK